MRRCAASPALQHLDYASLHPRTHPGRHVLLHRGIAGAAAAPVDGTRRCVARAFASVRAQRPFTIDAAVILPDHLHCIWTLPDGDTDFSGRWHAIKSRFSRSLPKEERLSARRIAKGERGIWQRRFWEHTIRDDEDFARHMDYIHYTLSNTATRGAFAIGRIRHSIDTFNTGYMRRIGVRATTCGRWIWSDVGRE